MLWRERQLLDLLDYKLEAERLFAESSAGWMPQATREVKSVAQLLRVAELERATVVADVARSLGLDPAASLFELAHAAPAPWSGILDRHRDAMTQSVAAVAGAALASRLRLVSALDDSVPAPGNPG